MSKEREALKLALEALEVATTPLAKDRQEVLRANTVIREALAQQRERVLFPTMLRKMWSGGEVQVWLDENVNKEQNT